MKRAVLSAAMLYLLAAPTSGSAQHTFFDSNGVQIHYVEQGTGEPVVLVHGSGGSVESWRSAGVFANLARDHRVIALDCRGHGKSGKPHDPRQYGREMALDIVRLLDHLRINTAHVVGYSMGAQLTALLVTLHPDRFLTATLGGAAGRFQWTAREDQNAEQEASEFERDGLSRSQARRLAPPNTPPETDEAFKKRAAAALADPTRDRFAMAALTRSRRDQVVTPAQLAKVTVPTLGVVGSADPYVKDFEALKKLRPTLKLVVIDGATHGGERGAMAHPEFLAVLREFIASHRSNRALVEVLVGEAR